MGQIWPIITIWEGLFFPVCPPRVILYHIKERNNIYLLGSVKASKMQIMNAGAIDRSWDWGKIIKEVRYSDSCTEVEIKLLKDAVRKAVGFDGDDAAWEKDRRCPHCYYIYGKRERIIIK